MRQHYPFSQTGQEIELGKDKITKNRSRLRAAILAQWTKKVTMEPRVAGSRLTRASQQFNGHQINGLWTLDEDEDKK